MSVPIGFGSILILDGMEICRSVEEEEEEEENCCITQTRATPQATYI